MKLLFSLTVLMISCSGSPKKSKEDAEQPKTTAPSIVGRIASVSKAGQFVLIQKYGPGFLPANALYQSRGSDGRTSSLRPSGERVRDFFAADLLSGNPQKGDAVLAYPMPKTEKDTDEIPPETPNGPPSNRPGLPTKNEQTGPEP
jgi:hypothetical protein